jgi:nicotinic acid mononucleotide adenylyltransferase
MQEGFADQEETPLDVFCAGMARLKPGQRAVVLLATGSLNPIHKAHVGQLERAAELVAATGDTVVVAAFLSPSDRAWSANKPHGSLENGEKVRLARLACAGHPLVRVDAWEASRGEPVDYPVVLKRLRQLCKGAEVVYVCGADHASKCGLWVRPWCVVVGRPGAPVPVQKSCLFVACAEGETDVSSTAVRRAAAEGRLAKAAPLLHPAVLARLLLLGPQVFS